MTGFFLAKGNWLPSNFFSLKESVQKWKMDIVCECGITCVVFFFLPNRWDHCFCSFCSLLKPENRRKN